MLHNFSFSEFWFKLLHVSQTKNAPFDQGNWVQQINAQIYVFLWTI